MRIYRAILCLLLVMLFAMSSGCLADNITIKGVVVDEYDNPIELAMVRAEGQSAMALCNLKGEYKISCIRRDSLVLVYTMIGYRTRKHVIQSPAADSMNVRMVLPSLGRQIDEATVKSYKRQTESMVKLQPKHVRLMPSTTGNGVEELVSTQMGVSTHNEMSSQYNVRGGSFDENCVYLNGVEVYRPFLVRSGQQEGLSIINSDMVEDINFSAGGFAAKYGDKMSSVLDIKYKRPEKTEATVSASMLGASGYLGFGNKKFSMMNGIRYKTTRYLLGSTDTNGEYKPNFFDYQNYTSWRPNNRWSFDFIGYVSSNHYTFEPEDRETAFGTMDDVNSFKVYFDGQEKDLFKTVFTSLGISHHFAPKTTLTLLGSFYSTKEQETYDIQGEYFLNNISQQEELGVGTYHEHARNYLNADVASIGLQFQHAFKTHQLQAGVEMQTQKVKENSTEWEMRDSANYSMPRNNERLDLIYSLRAQTEINTTRTQAYLQDTWRFRQTSGMFTLNYGVRMSHWSWNKETLISPRASLGFIPAGDDNLTLRFATGLYYQPPFYKELRDTITTSSGTIVSLNRDIKAQRAVHILFGGDYNFRMSNRPYRFTTEVYYKALSNLIPYNINNMRVVYYGENKGTGHVLGLDFKVFGEFVPGTDSWITLSLMDAKQTINGRKVSLPTDQRYNLSLFFTDYFPGTDRFKMTLKGALAGGLPFGKPHGGIEKSSFRAPAYRRVDIGMSYRLLNNEDHHKRSGFGAMLRNAWLGVDVFNVLGIENVNSYYWVTDITNCQYAVPNYLTGRLLNFRVLLEM